MRICRYLTMFLITVSLLSVILSAVSADQRFDARTAKSYGRLPLSFIENRGQLDKQVKYAISGPKASAFFRNDGVTFDLWTTNEKKRLREMDNKPEAHKHSVLKLTFKGADSKCQVMGLDQLSGKVNQMIGKDKSRWHTDIPAYKGVVYKNIWNGIDVIYRGDRHQLKYDIRINPGADIGEAQLQYDGMQKLRLDNKGALHIRTAITEFIERVPGIYQEKNGKKISVTGGYKLLNKNTIGFSVKNADPSLPLIIDPASDLLYSTFLGGAGTEYGYGIAVDSNGSAYIIGQTESLDFPTTSGVFDTSYNGGSTDVFVAKLNPSGSGLEYSTFLGGLESEYGCGIAVDSSGYAYITGVTYSSDFPTTAGAFSETFNSFIHGQFAYSDAFAAKLNPSGNGLEYSTFLGGGSYDQAYSIAVDSSGCAYVTGQTTSYDFPTTSGAFNSDAGYGGFITKLNASGSALEYSTLLGGQGGEVGRGIAVDSSGCAFITGEVRSPDVSNFPTTPDAFDPVFNGSYYDAFVTKLNASGSGLEYSTFLGGIESDFGTSIAVDASDCAYVTGYTWSSDYPTTTGAYDTSFNGGSYDAFVTKLNASGSSLVYSSFLGGTAWDRGFSIAVDSSHCAYVTGNTTSYDFPVTPGGFNTSYRGYNDFNDGGDVYVARLNPSGSMLQYSTFLGGTGSEEGYGITLGPSGCAYVTGITYSTDFPTTPGAFDKTLYGGDVFVSKLLINPAPVNVSLTPDSGSIVIGRKTSLTSLYSDPAGYSNIRNCYLALNTGTSSTGTGYLFYDAVKNKLYLRKMNESVMIGGYAPGKGQVIDNGCIVLYCNSTTIQKSGDHITINWSIMLKPYFNGNSCTALMQVTNKTGLADPLERMGTFDILPDPLPINVSLSPDTGTIAINQKTALTSLYSDPAGYSNIKSCYLVMNTGATTSGAGYFFYNAVKNKLYLRKTDEAVMIGGYAPGSANVIDNGSVILYCADTSVQKSGNEMTINWSIALKSYFAGNPCTASMQVTNKAGDADPLQQMGSFNVN